MPQHEAPSVELGSAPETHSVVSSPSPSELSSASSPEPHQLRATPLFRALALPPPEPEQPAGQDELERRLPGYRRIVIPRELTLIELLKQCSGINTDEEVLGIREARLRVVAERVGLRRLHVLAPRLRSLTLDGSAISSLRELGVGLLHLKILSVNRCGLTCLDGVWGLSSLRELHASGNRLQELHPVAVLQKLHTLNLADNPIQQASRLWTLGMCGSLRKLTLRGSPAAADAQYRTQVACALPLLVYLDDSPLHVDACGTLSIQTSFRQMCKDDSSENMFEAMSSSSDSEGENGPEKESSTSKASISAEPQPGTSQSADDGELDLELKLQTLQFEDSKVGECAGVQGRRRPATTESLGNRPRLRLPPRPNTAHDHRRQQEPTRLQILNTLLDEEWRCSGSALTSRGPVCGNLARALRQPASVHQNQTASAVTARYQEVPIIEEASCSIAEEIPRAPRLEDWTRFRQDTGIDIELDFNARPKSADPNVVIEKLEQIEKETSERLHRESLEISETSSDVTGSSGWGRSQKHNRYVDHHQEDDYPDNPLSDVISTDNDILRDIEHLNFDSYEPDVDAIFNYAAGIPPMGNERNPPRYLH